MKFTAIPQHVNFAASNGGVGEWPSWIYLPFTLDVAASRSPGSLVGIDDERARVELLVLHGLVPA